MLKEDEPAGSIAGWLFGNTSHQIGDIRQNNCTAPGPAMVGQRGNELLLIIATVSRFDRRGQGAREIGGCSRFRNKFIEGG